MPTKSSSKKNRAPSDSLSESSATKNKRIERLARLAADPRTPEEEARTAGVQLARLLVKKIDAGETPRIIATSDYDARREFEPEMGFARDYFEGGVRVRIHRS